MGWNSWNKFGCDVSEKLIRDTADAMVSSGLRDAGYIYISLDDCWQGQRDADGFIQPDPVRFPSGIKALADYVHARGLKPARSIRHEQAPLRKYAKPGQWNDQDMLEVGLLVSSSLNWWRAAPQERMSTCR